ncbi:MAG TPA: ATPase domain-containing protein [Candidatus Sumerlaeota bacterium]|nr:ATPase domain-containing protein [Candidatus Sumerlaeota bacterium]
MAEHITTTPARLRTGVAGLDELLGGGLLAGRTVLLKGSPGSGKTTLGLQMLIAGATQFNEPGILVTFEQAPEQLYADTAGFGWDLRRLGEEGKVQTVFIEPEEMIEHRGRQANRLLVNIADWVDDYGCRRILIDSISHLSTVFTNEEARAGFLKFVMQLKSMGLTPIMTAELDALQGLMGLDAYLVDAVIHLHHEGGSVGTRERRNLEILKTRGYQHVGGRHPLEIGRNGVVVFPHTYPAADAAEAAAAAPVGADAAPVSTGVHALDLLLSGGYREGSTALIAGLSGTFKSTLAGHFLLGGGGEAPAPGLWLSFHESTADLIQSFGWREMDLAGAVESGRVRVMELAPGQEPVEKIYYRAAALIAEHGIGRVVIDTLGDLTLGLGRAEEAREAERWFLRRLKALGVTTLATQQLVKVTGRNPLSEIGAAELADTIIYLGLVEIESRLEKVMSVLKHRGGPVSGDLRAIACGAGGLQVSERFVGLSGLLDGTARGQRKTQIEEVFQPLYFIRDFLKMASRPDLDPARRGQMLERLEGETSRVIASLAQYFDLPLGETDTRKDSKA